MTLGLKHLSRQVFFGSFFLPRFSFVEIGGV